MSFVLAGALTLSSVGCKSKKSLETKVNEPITVNGEKYKFRENKIVQLTSDEDNIAKYGVISDIHGEVYKAELFAQKFKSLGLDGIILTGDLSYNETLRYGRKDSKPDKEEIKEVLEVVAKTGLPVFVIPGNHERKSDYESALKEITKKYSNVFDMTKFRIFDGDDVDFVSLPGYQIFKIPGRQFIPDDGFYANPDFIEKTGKLTKGLDDVVVLITHGPPYTHRDGKLGPGTIYSGKDVGDKTTSEMMKEYKIPFSISGHIHEAGGYASTLDGNFIPPGKFVSEANINFGTLEKWRNLNGKIYNGMAGILTVKGNKAKYEILYLK